VKRCVDSLISNLEATGMIQVVRDENGRPIETKIIRLVGIPSDEAVGKPALVQEDTLSERDDERDL
jgi:hypothetical protein